VLALILVSGLAVRLPSISTGAFVFHSGRQFNSALLARNYELGGGPSSADVDQRVASAGRGPLAEPPLLAIGVAAIWRLVGAEPLGVGGVLASLCWTLGGWWIYALGRRLSGRIGGLVAAGVFMWAPLGILSSRSFLPDPVMVAAIVGATLLLVIDDAKQDRRSFWLAALAGGFALFLKSVAIFFVVPVLAALAVQRDGWRGLVRRRTIGMVAVTLIPAVLWQFYSASLLHFPSDQTAGRILPELLVTSHFWSAWWNLATLTAGLMTLLIAVVGLVVAAPRTRWVIGSLFAGYIVFGLLFDYHYSTHIYYHLPLLVPVSLGAGVAIEQATGFARSKRTAVSIAVVVSFGAVLVMNVFQGPVPLIDPGRPAAVVNGFRDTSVAVGQATNHSTRVIMLAPADGDLLRFYGHLAGATWPRAFDLAYARVQGRPDVPIETRFDDTQQSPGGFDYFAATSLDELALQPELEQLLDARYRRVTDCGGTCVVWDLTSAKTSG
jgi:hypothetical protein